MCQFGHYLLTCRFVGEDISMTHIFLHLQISTCLYHNSVKSVLCDLGNFVHWWNTGFHVRRLSWTNFPFSWGFKISYCLTWLTVSLFPGCPTGAPNLWCQSGAAVPSSSETLTRDGTHIFLSWFFFLSFFFFFFGGTQLPVIYYEGVSGR